MVLSVLIIFQTAIKSRLFLSQTWFRIWIKLSCKLHQWLISCVVGNMLFVTIFGSPLVFDLTFSLGPLKHFFSIIVSMELSLENRRNYWKLLVFFQEQCWLLQDWGISCLNWRAKESFLCVMYLWQQASKFYFFFNFLIMLSNLYKKYVSS